MHFFYWFPSRWGIATQLRLTNSIDNFTTKNNGKDHHHDHHPSRPRPPCRFQVFQLPAGGSAWPHSEILVQFRPSGLPISRRGTADSELPSGSLSLSLRLPRPGGAAVSAARAAAPGTVGSVTDSARLAGPGSDG
eukprot:1386844-Rhodomonas_salina.1